MFTLNIVVGIAIVVLFIALYYTEKKKKKGILVLLLLIASAALNQGKEIMNYHSEWQARRTTKQIVEEREKEGISDMARADSPKQHYPPEIMAKVEKLERIEKSGIELHPKAYYEMGIAAYNQEDYREAARKLSIAVTLDEGYLAAWNFLGLSYSVLGQLDSALSCFQTGFELVRGRHLLMWEGDLLNNIASIHHERGQLEEAVEFYQASLSAYGPRGRSNRSITYNNMAVAFSYMGLPDSASRYYDMALALADREDFDIRSAIFENRGWAFGRLEMLDSALVYFQMALSEDEKHNIKWIKASTWGALGFVYYLKGELAKSDSMLTVALDLDRQVGCRAREARHLRFLALLEVKKGDKEKAILFMDRALRIDREGGYLIGEAEDYQAYGDIWKSLGDDEQAKKYYVLSLNLFMQMKMAPKIAQSEAKLRAVLWPQ